MASRGRVLSLLGLLALSIALGAGGVAASPERTSGKHPSLRSKTPSSFFGVVPQDVLGSSDYAQMGRSGVKTLRAGLYWTQAQPLPLPLYDFSRFDDLVLAAAENGITVLPYLYGSPDWVAKGLDQNLGCSGNCRVYAPQSQPALGQWQQFAAMAAKRYGPGGDLWKANPDLRPRPIRTWQIWNEQNSKTFYLPEPDPKGYAQLLSAAAAGLRSQDPTAKIVLGGMFGLPGKNDASHAIAAADFLRGLLKVKGAKKSFDGYALHPYAKGLGFVRKQVTVARKQMRKSGYPGAELWITETGAASGGAKSGLNLGSKKAQAERVTDTYKLFERKRKAWNVKLVAWFAWQDSSASDAICFFCAKAGLITTSGKAKPSLKAYKRVAR